MGGSATAVPVTALAVIVVGWIAARGEPRVTWAHAALWVVVGVFIALTPVVMFRGTAISLPIHRLAALLGVYRAVRIPPRLAIGALLGLCLLTGLGFAACVAPLRARAGAAGHAAAGALAALVVAAMYRDAAIAPGWLGRQAAPARYAIAPAPAPEPGLTRAIAEHGGPVLELPLGPRGVGPPQHARAMYASIFHWQPVVNGYSSYWPAGFLERMALAQRLPDPEALAALRRETGLRLLLVHMAGMYGPRQIWLNLAGMVRPDLRLLAREGDDLLFVVGGEGAE
jgi:hypothetical protein